MITRDTYIALLEKRASEDNLQTAMSELSSNRTDSNDRLKKLFDNSSSVEKTDSKHVGKLFPGKSKKEVGNELMKIARDLFKSALTETELLKTSEPAYVEVAFRGFLRELEKIGAWVGAGSGALHTALDAARKKPQTISGTAQKFIGQLQKLKQLAQGSVVSSVPKP